MKAILETVFVSCPDRVKLFSNQAKTPWGVSCEIEGEACCKIRMQETQDTKLLLA